MGKKREDRDINIVESMTLSSPIPESEERKLVAAIDEAVVSTTHSGHGPRIQAMASGTVFPLVAASLVLVAAAVVALFFARSITSGEADIISETQTYFTADEMIIAQVRRDSERKLKLKDKEISEIKVQLLELQLQRDSLNQSLEESLREKEAELRMEMGAAIEREKLRLQDENTSDAEITREIADLTKFQEASFARGLAEYASENELRTALRESELEDKRALVEKALIEAESEKVRLIEEAQPVGNAGAEAVESSDRGGTALERQSQIEALVVNRILTSYAAIAASVENSDFAQASGLASELLDFLKSDEYALTPGLDAQGDSERFIATALVDYFDIVEGASAGSGDIEKVSAALIRSVATYVKNLTTGSDEIEFLKALGVILEEDMQRFSSFDSYRNRLASSTDPANTSIVAALDIVGQFLSRQKLVSVLQAEALSSKSQEVRIGELELAWATEKESLEQIVEDLRLQIDALTPYASAAADGEVLRNTVSNQRRRLDSRLNALPESGPPSSIELLETKLLVVDILNSPEIAEEHPDLSSRLNVYLRALVQDEQAGGRISSLEDIATVLDNLLSGESDPLGPLSELSDKAQLVYVVEVLTTIEMLLSRGLPK